MSTAKTNAARRGRVYQWHGAWYVDFTVHGRRVRKVAAEATNEKQAWTALDNARAEERERGSGPDLDRTRLAAILTRLKETYEAAGIRPHSFSRMKQACKRLEAYFGATATARGIPDRAPSYVVARRRQEGADATIRFEVWVLAKAFKLAKLPPVEWPSIQVRNTRKEFFTAEELDKVLAELPGELRPPVRFAYLTAWRKSEVLGLRWSQVDFQAGVVRLDVGTTKNKDGRFFPIAAVPELRALLEAQRDVTQALQRATGRIVPHVFYRGTGRPIVAMECSWNEACKRAGLAGRHFHDLRRSGALNLRRAGLSESDIMELCGWKSRAMFQRYSIKDEAGLAHRLARAVSSGYGTSAAPSPAKVVAIAAER